jgi:ubiquitin-protein ligase
MTISQQQFNQQGLSESIINIYDELSNSLVLLDNIDFPRNEIPEFNDQRSFWTTVFSYISVHEGDDFEPLLRAAARMYPYNQALIPFVGSTQTASANKNTKSGISIVFGHYQGEIAYLSQQIEQATQHLQLPNNVEQLYYSYNVAAFHLPGITMEQGGNILHLIQQTNANLNINCLPYRDYLISHLFVEGPDQARFELNNIPASTPNGEVARAVMSQYHGEMWPEGRQAVTDFIQADGNNRRLPPNSSLHDCGINDGGTLHVSPEATAGAINPILREQALVRVKRQIQEYAKNGSTFKVTANSWQAPTEYTLAFTAPSWAPPSTAYGVPQSIDQHQVQVLLPPDFPMKAPLVKWLTPIFHPNIQPRNGAVCLGVLAENYRPALDFKELCQMLVDIASFQNYAIVNGYYNREAKDWAISEAGQAAILSHGGKALTINSDGSPPSTSNDTPHCLRIRRLEL